MAGIVSIKDEIVENYYNATYGDLAVLSRWLDTDKAISTLREFHQNNDPNETYTCFSKQELVKHIDTKYATP